MNNVSDHDDDQGGFEMAVTKIDLKNHDDLPGACNY